MRSVGILTILALLLSSCIEEFRPVLDKYDELLVVDGGITNEPGPYTVKLSLSKQVHYLDIKPYPGAQVIISDNEGNTETLIETWPGAYTTSPWGIQGVPGREYKITINTPGGETYESEYELLQHPTPIDSVYAELEYRQHRDYELYDLAGYQFYLDTYPSENNSKHFLWKLETTYQYQSDFYIKFKFDGTLEPFPIDAFYNCWKTQYVDQIFTFNVNDLSEPKIIRFPLHYVTTETRELTVRYSLLAKQYAISEKAYLFWNNLENQEEQQGALYSSQPFQIRGNLTNMNNPEEPVLGYFLVASVSQKRIFVDRPPSTVKFHYPRCSIGEANFQAFGEMWMTDPVTWPLFTTTQDGRNALTNQPCVDCRLRGGTIEKPEFWID